MAAERSDYFYTLDLEAAKRYVAKTSLISGADPYTMKQRGLSRDIALLPYLR